MNLKELFFYKHRYLFLLIFLSSLITIQAQTTYIEGHFREVHTDELKLGERGVDNYFRPDVVALTDGGFVVTFSNGGNSIGLQRYDAFGAKVGEQITVSEGGALPQFTYAILLKNGNIVVGWDGGDPTGEQGGFVGVAQIYEIPEDGAPIPLGGNFTYNDPITRNGWQFETTFAELENGDLLFAWLSRNDGLFKGRVLKEDGTPRTDEFVVNDHYNAFRSRQGGQQDAYINAIGLPGGGFAITWFTDTKYANDGQDDIAARVYQGFENGYAPLTDEFQVNPNGERSSQRNPVVNNYKDGFFIVYENFRDIKIKIRKFDNAGNAYADASSLNPNDADHFLRYKPDVVELSDGGFVVVTGSMEVPASGGIPQNIYGQNLDEDLNPVGNPFLVNFDTSENDISPFAAGLLNERGGFVAIWTNNKDGGNNYNTTGIRIYSEDIMAVEDELTFFDDLSHVSIHDSEDPEDISISLSVTNGTLSAVSGDGVVVVGDQSSNMTLDGSPSALTSFIQSGAIGYLGNEHLFGNNADELVVISYDALAPTIPVAIGAFNIDIAGTPDPAVIAGDIDGSVTEDRNLNADEHLQDHGKLTIFDPDGPSEQVFANGIYRGAFGKLVLASNGTWIYTIDNSLEIVQNLNFGQSFIDKVIVRSIDGTQQIITITINGENELTLEAEATDLTVECGASNMDELNNWLSSNGTTGAVTDACGEVIWTHNYDGQFDEEGTHGNALVTFTATDECGNEVSTSATFTIEDTTAPTITCITDITVGTDESSCEAILVLEIPETADNCKVVSVTHNAPELYPIGETAVLWVVTDGAGNTTSCEQIITVEDNELPIALCSEPFEVLLDENGIASITAEEIDAGSTDNCAIAAIEIDQSSFDCSHIGENTIVLTITDESGNIATCQTTVTVKDEAPPVAFCKNITLSLDDTGSVSISPEDIDDGSSDNCGIASIEIDQALFDCGHLGENTITLTVTDESGNTETCESTVTIIDDTNPTIVCPADLTVNADDGSCEASVVLESPETNDNCEVASVTNNAPESFSIGETLVTWAVTDTSGNTATCEQVISVEDTEAPIAICVTSLTIPLDDNGNATITVDDINSGSSDNCGIASIEIDQTTFDCSDLGEHTVTLTVIDESGNESTCTTTVTVEDNEAPVVMTQNISVELDASGNAVITTFDIDDGSYDACGIASMSLDITNFDCPTLDDHEVTLTVTDLEGNTASETAMVRFTAPDQDGDDIADVCDDDIDGDGIDNTRDNCVTTANPSQLDLDRNGVGDVCDNGGLVIPKGFSPNGDGINDTFVIGGLFNYPNNRIEFYNRWGNLVYETQHYQNDWNGVAFNKSRTLPAAPYFYVIDLGDSSEIIKGWVYINY